MTLLNKFPVTTLPDYVIEKIAENTIERENKLVASRANLATESIGPFIDALRRNTYLYQNNDLFKYATHVLQYSTALEGMPNEQRELNQIINTAQINNPSFFARQTLQRVVRNEIEINAPRML